MELKTFVVMFGKLDSLVVKATSKAAAVRLARAMDPELSNLARSRRMAVKAAEVAA